GVVHALPMFAVLPAHRVLPADRSARANRSAFRASGFAGAEADQAGGLLGPERPTVGGVRPSLLLAALHSAWRRIRLARHACRTAEAADDAGDDDHPIPQSREATGDAHRGGSALDRPDHAGVPEHVGRSDPHRTYPC